MDNPIGRLLDTTLGFRGRQNLLAWAFAGGLAYYFIYLPEQRKIEERKVIYEQRRNDGWCCGPCARGGVVKPAQYIERRKYYEEKGLWDIDRAKPVPDKQQNGLLVGSAAIRAEEELQQRLRQRRQGAAAAAAIEAPAADEAAVQAVPAVAAVAGGRESVAEVPVIKHVDTLAAGGQPAVQTPVAEQGGAPER
ncbi:hypothetical protein CHLRE_12g518851v5 [Chlamydomonas reinhardtii]|uniref:Uncharacterized protein n=1 Tax=Chlamydomonas reinhardtii TaxID=3055 RepID=A0A2K3D3Y5_CHLRE|nr:uncharacterized protein CHLRE_12g518851v5 [Chlamydomonas reinhardtii]PNW75245.1 hypothetical protein CHLRE_12g518851v5 [Chlamydomonas reinhardtii]